MKIDNFIKHIEEEFTCLPKNVLNKDSNYKEVIGLSSINALILIALIDNAYDVLLSAEDIKSTQTVNELFEIVKKHKNI